MKWAIAAIAAFVALSTIPTPATAATNVAVSMIDFAFVPAAVTMPLDTSGNTVTYTNNGIRNHFPRSNTNGSPLEGACLDSGVLIPPGGSATVSIKLTPQCVAAIAAAGAGSVGTNSITINYHCDIHQAMMGTVTLTL